jgi:hypothetical protein
MAFSSDPVIVPAFNDTMDERQVIDTYMQTVELAEAIDGPVYRVIDLREAQQSAERIVATLGELVRGLSGATVTPNLTAVFAGYDVQSQYQSFDTLEEALDYAHTQVAEPVR